VFIQYVPIVVIRSKKGASMHLSVLSDSQINKIHNESLKILEKIGVHVPHENVLDLFADAGADVDKATQIVRIPGRLVESCIKKSVKQFVIYGRDRTKKAEFGAGKRNYNSIGGEPMWVEDNLERRFATLEDVATAARIVDALPLVNIAGAMSDAHEIPVEYRYLYIAAELFKNTTKPIMFWFNDRPTSRFVLDLFTIVAGSEEEAIKYPFAYPFLEPISPLRFPRNGVDLLFETARFNLPVPIGPMAQTGATAPGTLAGTMAQENAEILAGNCIVQLIKPGTPVCYGGIPHAFDMRTTQMIFAGPEQALMAVGMTQMGKFYGLPVYINVGLSDSKVTDAQAGLEAGITLAMGAMAGADIFGHLGICGVDQGTSLIMLIMQHELIGYVERIMKGVEVSDERFGVEIIENAKESGSFLGEEHTARYFREELWFPDLLDRNFWDNWVNKGKKDMAARCKEMKDKLLKEHVPDPLDSDVQKEIVKLLGDVKKHLSR
jgi:trimethylamine--corrinoid protein Co-methyltransferase